MRKIATTDCETDPFEHGAEIKPFIWALYEGEKVSYFKTVDEMIDFLKDKEWIVYAHNGGKFDYHFLLHLLEPYSKIMNINGRLAKFKIGKCEFRDSYNILPVPLSAYKKDEIDYNKFKRSERHKHMDEIRHYLAGDVIYLYELIQHFQENYGHHLTLASAAFNFFFKFLREEKPCKTSKDFYDELSDFYYGGRVECFFKGIIKNDFFVVDVNSAYPNAMTFDHPYGSKFTYSRKLSDDRKIIEKSFINLEARSLGAFPFLNDKKELSFPNDNEIRLFQITGWEFLAALDTGCLKDCVIKSVYTFDESINFRDYVAYFFDKKKKAAKNSPDYITAKLFLNSLYGKFAANPEKYKDTIICPQELAKASCDELDLEHTGDLGQWALLEKDIPFFMQSYYNVATAASITGFQRAFLFRSIKACKNVLYCDTDSIACEDYSRLNISENLGDWDLEGEFSGGGIGGKKLYAFKYKNKEGYKIARKGSKITAQEILEVCKGHEVLYKSHAPSFSMKRGKFYLERKVKMT